MYFLFFSEQEPQVVIPKEVSCMIISKKAVVPKKSIKPKSASKKLARTDKKVGLCNSGNNCFMNAVWQALR